MNWEGCERKRWRHNLRCYTGIGMEGLKKITNSHHLVSSPRFERDTTSVQVRSITAQPTSIRSDIVLDKTISSLWKNKNAYSKNCSYQCDCTRGGSVARWCEQAKRWTSQKTRFSSWRGPIHPVQRPGHETAHTPPSSVKVYNTWSYKVVQIWPGQTVASLQTISPGHIWTTLYNFNLLLIYNPLKNTSLL